MPDSAAEADGPLLGEAGEAYLSVRSVPRDAAAALALTFVGAVSGNAIIGSVPDRANALSAVPEFNVWATLIAAQIGLWALLLPTSILTLRRIPTRYDVPLLKLSALYVGLGTVVAGSLARRGGRRCSTLRLPNPALTIVGFVASRTLRQTGTTWSSADARVIEHLMYLRSTLQRLLAILAVIVAALTLAAGAQHNAVIAWGERFGVAVEFPAVLVVLYGLLFTVVVALVYVPVYVRLESAGHAFVGNASGAVRRAGRRLVFRTGQPHGAHTARGAARRGIPIRFRHSRPPHRRPPVGGPSWVDVPPRMPYDRVTSALQRLR